MKRTYWQTKMLCVVLLFALSVTTPLYAIGYDSHDWIDGIFRTDLPETYSSGDYRLDIQADAIPTTGLPTDATSGWLAVFVDPSLADTSFFQVGLLAQTDGLHWFAEMFDGSSGGIACFSSYTVYWNIVNPDGTTKPGGCRGTIGDIVNLGQYYSVELLRESASVWTAWIYSPGATPIKVAKFNIASTRVYRVNSSFEQAYSEAVDPQLTGKFHFRNPQYKAGSTWKNFPQSAVYKQNFLNPTRKVGTAFIWPPIMVPSVYAATTNCCNNIWEWYAGSVYAGMGVKQVAWLFPPTTIEDSATSFLTYTGSWSSNNTFPNAWFSTEHWATSGNKVSFTTSPSNSISRVYAMATNRATDNTVKVSATPYPSNDQASNNRWQVTRSWPASGSTAVEVTAGNTGFVDADAFIVDIPRYGPPPAPGTSVTYDDYHYLLHYIGNWTHASNGYPSAHGETISWTNNAEDAISFTFEGGKITYYYTKASNRGKAAVTIDGVATTTIDACSAATVWQVPAVFTVLPGIHTIHIANTGQTTCGAGNTNIDVDKFVVEP